MPPKYITVADSEATIAGPLFWSKDEVTFPAPAQLSYTQHEVPFIDAVNAWSEKDPSFLTTKVITKIRIGYEGAGLLLTASTYVTDEELESGLVNVAENVVKDQVEQIIDMTNENYDLHPMVLAVFRKDVFDAMAKAIGGPTGGTPPNGGVIISGAIYAGDINANPLSLGTGGGVSETSKKLPAMDQVIDLPCDCPQKIQKLWHAVQHLNDQHDWTREKIADWIDELHDAGVINAEFQPWGEGEKESDDSEEFLNGGVVSHDWQEIGYVSEFASTANNPPGPLAQFSMDEHGNISKIIADVDVNNTKYYSIEIETAEWKKSYDAIVNSQGPTKKELENILKEINDEYKD